jgi:hypothetical protein
VRRVLERETGKLLIENFATGFNHFWMRVGYLAWCENTGAEAVSVGIFAICFVAAISFARLNAVHTARTRKHFERHPLDA